MTRPKRFDILFEPVPIGPKTLRNRFYATPQCTGFGDVFPGGQAYHRAMKAEGGWAAVNTEATTIGPEFDWAGQITPSRIWDDDDVRNWSLMTEKVHEHGALAGMELHAGGAFITTFDSRVPARHIHGRLEEAGWLGSVQAITKRDIREIQSMYVAASRRAVSAGFDIVNIHGAEIGTLPVQFLMNVHNSRTDEYGGSFENRARFWIETLEQVREAIGETTAVAARFCIDSLHGTDAGIRVEEEGVGFIEMADHLVDFWDLQVGGQNAELWIKDAGPSRFYPENFQSEWIKKVRPYTKKPIVGVGRFTDPESMLEVVTSGQVDIIGAARPTISDPFIPKKIEEGRFEDIRECIGCNVCVSRVNAGWHLICTQNPTSGEEYKRGWHPERFSLAKNRKDSVLVVGAGAAGMEFAMVLGMRGFGAVHLAEAGASVGGHLQWVADFPGMSMWRRVIDWRVGQIDKLQSVSVVMNREMTAREIVDYGADIVVLATGSSWDRTGLNGFTHVPLLTGQHGMAFTPEDLMRDDQTLPGDSVVVFDVEGYFMGVSMAEKLTRDGYSVTLVTPHIEPGPYMRFTGEIVDMQPMLERLGVKLITGHVVSEVGEGFVRLVNGNVPEMTTDIGCDGIVMVTQRVADDGLWHQLQEMSPTESTMPTLYRVGDCVAPRMLVADAIFDGHRLAREIDSDDPGVPLPYIRERRLVGSDDERYEQVISGQIRVESKG